MTFPRHFLPVLAALLASPADVLADYVGVLRPSPAPFAAAVPDPGLRGPFAAAFGRGAGLTAGEGFRLKLGYRYSRFFSVESGYAQFGSAPLDRPVAGSPSWGRGLRLDTIGTLPLWPHGALYGRFGAWRVQAGTSLLPGTDAEYRAGAGLRVGLGFKVDLTRRLGLRAEMERLAPLDRWGGRDADIDQLSVGVTWRF